MTTQEIMGLKIKELRIQKELSQTNLAEMVGYKDKTSIAKIESGKVDLPQSKIIAFARALNTTPSYLFGNEEEHESITTIAAHKDGDNFTAEELEKIEEYKKLLIAARPKD